MLEVRLLVVKTEDEQHLCITSREEKRDQESFTVTMH